MSATEAVKGNADGEKSTIEVVVSEQEAGDPSLFDTVNNVTEDSHVAVTMDMVTHDDAKPDVAKGFVALTPTLRVEELRDEDADGRNSSACSYMSGMSGEEDGFASHGDGSDNPDVEKVFTPPSEELQERIIKQVEFYFSDANILKDTFLLKHVRRNKMGYVSLKLITGFRKVKSLTKDFRDVAYSLRKSDKLEVNEEGTKVKRVTPLPEYDETIPSRTVVVINLPMENPSIESVAELFSKSGDIALIRILRPGKTVPNDVKKYINKHPEIGTTICALIEFEQHDSAVKACEDMTNTDDWRKGMRVVLLNIAKKKSETEKKGNKKEKSKQQTCTNDDENEEDGEKKSRNKRGARKKRNSRVEELFYEEGGSSCYSSGSEAEPSVTPPRPNNGGRMRSSLSPKTDPNRLSPNASPRASPRNSPNTRRRGTPGKSPLADRSTPSPRDSPDVQRKWRDEGAGDSSGQTSPWVQRRLKAAQESPLTQDASPGTSPLMGRRGSPGIRSSSPVPRMANMEGVLRQPKGPDGTLGFYGGKGRGAPISKLAV